MKIFFSVFLCVFSFNVIASLVPGTVQRAVTDEGDIVILFNDGTWKYEQESQSNTIEIPMNNTAFEKPADANFTLKSTKTDAQFVINAKKWTFKKSNNGHDVAEYTFEQKGSDLYGMVISEEIQIGVEQLASIAFDNAKLAGPDIEVIKKEYRMVNGNKVIYMEMEGTIQSIKVRYLGYYFSNASGSTQYLIYTGSNLVEKYKEDIAQFLNGFSIQP